jgi:glycosyltransferase involved in cell wall biosynthesis
VRILFATTQAYLPQRVGGSQLSTHELSIELSSRGHRVAVLCELQRPLDGTRIRNRMMARVCRRPHPCDQWRPYRVYRGYGATHGIRAVARTFRPDVAIVQSGTAVPLVTALLEDRIRTVLYFRDVQFAALGGCIPRHGQLRFVANSAFTASRVATEFGIEAPVIPPLVRPAAYRTANRGRHVLFVNPVAKKGLETALELASRNPTIPFVFLESWPLDRPRVDALAGALRHLRNVRFRRATLKMPEEYAQAKILLVPSVWEEPWARVVTEAQLSAIPVVATAIGGLPESVGPGGILVAPGSSADVWSDHLKTLWESEHTYGRYRRLALDHSRRAEIEPARLLTQLLEVVAGSW